jgi:putative phage-type endonuclease
MVPIKPKPGSALTPEQMEIRSKGVGGSEIGPVAGLSPWAGPLSVYAAKTGQDLIEDNENMQRGRFLESGVRKWYEAKTGYTVKEVSTLVHPQFEFVRSTPDGIVSDGFNDLKPLEIKIPASFDHWGDGLADIPYYYLPQVTWEMACAGLKQADVAAVLRGRLKIYTIEFDMDLFITLKDIAEDFWYNNVQKRIPPPPDGTQAALEYLNKQYPQAQTKTYITSDQEDEYWISQLKEAQTKKAEYEQLEREAKANLMNKIGSNYGMIGDNVKLSYYNVRGREKTDWLAIAKKYNISDETIKQYTGRGMPTRAFRPTWKGE